jgi:uncharacterized MAPEG superfamily protein
MTTPLWCLAIVAFIPYLLALLAIPYRIKQFGDWDNNNPRAQYASMEGAGWRVWAAQQNAWEALALFSVAVVVAHLAGADAEKSALAALLFVATRVLHPVLYIANLATLRSLVVVIGLFSCIYMFILAANA